MKLYPPLKHPLHPAMSLSGSDFNSLESLVSKISATSREERWTTTNVTISSPDFMHVQLDMPGNLYILGEIGLHYLVYRLDPDSLSLARSLYRSRNLVRLRELIDALMTKPSRHSSVIVTSIDTELLGILNRYTFLPNSAIVDIIKKTGTEPLVRFWTWTPLRCRIYLSGKTMHSGFRMGMIVTNGETGHVALSYVSAVWAHSIMHPADKPLFEWETPITDRGYSRHVSTRRLKRQLESFYDSMKDNVTSLAFELLPDIEAAGVMSAIEHEFANSKARQSVKDKFDAAFTDASTISARGTALDVVDSIMLIADMNGTKAMANFATEIIDSIIDDIKSSKLKKR